MEIPARFKRVFKEDYEECPLCWQGILEPSQEWDDLLECDECGAVFKIIDDEYLELYD